MSRTFEDMKGRLSTDEAREIGKKGGVASALSRRQKKLLKECASMYGALDIVGESSRALLAKLGVSNEDMTNLMGVTVGLFNRAMKGDVSAYNAIRDILGEKPSDSIELNEGMPGKIEIEFVEGPEDGSEPKGVYTSIEELEADIKKFDAKLK